MSQFDDLHLYASYPAIVLVSFELIQAVFGEFSCVFENERSVVFL